MTFLKRFILFVTCLLTAFSGWNQEVETPVGNYRFFQNKGQWPNGVLYCANTGSGNVWLEQGRILYHFLDYSALHAAHANPNPQREIKSIEFKQDIVTASFLGSNTDAETSTKYPTTDYRNYFLGNKSERWASEVYGYYHVEYENLYKGINLLFFEKVGELKYEFHVSPGADPAAIRIQYEGHKKIKLDKSGNLEIHSRIGAIRENKPYAYQIRNGRIVEIECTFLLDQNGEVSFELGEYDQSVELIIDPELIFATYSGSVSNNFGMTGTFAYDGKGYSAGIIFGNAYPTPGPGWNTTPTITVENLAGSPTTDVFVSKYNEDGTEMIWTNFLGGGDDTQGTETAHSLICDSDNNIYVYGATSSTDFPIEGGFQTENNGGTPFTFTSTGTDFDGPDMGGTDIYVAKFSSDGLNLLGSTYIGGTENDGVNYMVTAGSYAGIASYDSLTTNYGDQFRGEIMLDSLNNIYVTSSTRSIDFPVVDPFQPDNGGKQDAVVFKISPGFSTLLWSSYYGGSENDAGYTVKIDSSYNVVFGGGTSSDDITGTTGSLQETYGGGSADGYLVKLTEDGSTIIQSTYVGTDSYDQLFFIEVDRWDNIYIVGQSLGDMPVSAGVYSNPGSAQFIWKMPPDLTAIEYSTVFGNGSGTIDISPSAFLVDFCGNVYVSGWGGNVLAPATGTTEDMPTTDDAFLEEHADGFDFYLIVLTRDLEDLEYGTYMGSNNAREHVDGGTSRFDKFGVVYQSVCGACGTATDGFPTTEDAWSAVDLATGGGCNNLLFKFDFEIVPVARFEVDLLEGCAPLTLTFDNESNDTINFSWEFGPGSEIITGGASPVVLFSEPGEYEVVLTITDTICGLTDTALKIITVYDELQLEVPNDTIVCNSFTYDLEANSFGTAESFIWSLDPDFDTMLNDDEMDSVITVSPEATTTYYITASNGWPLCDLVDSVVVTFVASAIEVSNDTTICLGDTLLLAAESLIPEIEIDFDWSPDTYIISESDGTALAIPPTSMYFYLTAVTDLGCVIEDSVWVEVQEIDLSTVTATATPDLVPEGGVSVLEAFPATGFDYQWLPITGLSNPEAQTTEAVVNETTTYTVIMDNGVCQVGAQVTVTTYEFICGDEYIFVPNAFSPNGDGENDVLYVRGQNLNELELKVFDRWGELVFETTDQAVGWDGTYKGRPVDPDVFVYHLRVTCFDDQTNLIKGNVTVLR